MAATASTLLSGMATRKPWARSTSARYNASSRNFPNNKTRFRGALLTRPLRARPSTLPALRRERLPAPRSRRISGRLPTGAELGTAGERLAIALHCASGEELACVCGSSIHIQAGLSVPILRKFGGRPTSSERGLSGHRRESRGPPSEVSLFQPPGRALRPAAQGIERPGV